MPKKVNKIESIKELRSMTGLSLQSCKNSLEKSNWDVRDAIKVLAESGVSDKITIRPTTEGKVISYVHGEGRVGVLLQVNCETDFVARCEDFGNFTREVCLQIAAMEPIYVGEDNIPKDVSSEKKRILTKVAKDSGKPERIIPNIIKGQMSKWVNEITLLNQVWVKDKDRKVQDLLDDLRKKTGENIRIVKFSRFEAGIE